MKNTLFLFGLIFLSSSCSMECEQHPIWNNFDTIVIKTDSCHFYMDSAFYTIDELKIEYQK